MGLTALVDGKGGAQAAEVTLDGKLKAEVESTTVTNTVTTQPAVLGVTNSSPTVGTTSATIVNALVGRRALQIKNLDPANAIHILLADGGTAAATDMRIDPGQTYVFPANASYDGPVQGIAITAPVQVSVVQFS